MASTIVFLLVFFFIPAMPSPVNSAIDQVKVEVTPSSMYEGLTKHVTVNCSYMHGPQSDFSTVMSLILSKTDSTGESEAYRYKCEAFGMDNGGHPQTSTQVVALEGKNTADNSVLLEKIKEMDLRLDQYAKQFANVTSKLEGTTTDLADVINLLRNSKNAFVEATTHFASSEYVLSPKLPVNAKDANRVCRLYGGYLVEINNKQEYDFVADFYRRHATGGEAIFIGATDEGQEGKWTFMTSQSEMTYFDWATGEPNKGTEENCLAIGGSTSKTLDVTCYRDTASVWAARFGCEIPHWTTSILR